MTLTREEKIDILNSFFLLEWDSSSNVIDYIFINNNRTNVDKLMNIGVPVDEIKAKTSVAGIDIAEFVFSYGEAEWLSETGEFLDYIP
jgi:hypothetical protein